jgi:hypothetical protein
MNVVEAASVDKADVCVTQVTRILIVLCKFFASKTVWDKGSVCHLDNVNVFLAIQDPFVKCIFHVQIIVQIWNKGVVRIMDNANVQKNSMATDAKSIEDRWNSKSNARMIATSMVNATTKLPYVFARYLE